MKSNLSNIVQRRIIGNSISASTTNRYTPVYNIIQMIRINLAATENWGKFVLVEPYSTQGIMFSNEKFSQPENIYELLYELPLDSAVTRYCTLGQYLSNINFKLFVAEYEGEVKVIGIPNDTGLQMPGVPVEKYLKNITAKKQQEYVEMNPMDITAIN